MNNVLYCMEKHILPKKTNLTNYPRVSLLLGALEGAQIGPKLGPRGAPLELFVLYYIVGHAPL